MNPCDHLHLHALRLGDLRQGWGTTVVLLLTISPCTFHSNKHRHLPSPHGIFTPVHKNEECYWVLGAFQTTRHTGVKLGRRNFRFNVHFNKAVPTHSIKFYRGPKVWLHSFLTLAPDLMARFTPRPLLSHVKEPQKQSDRKLSRPQSLSRKLRRKEESSALVENRTNSYSSNNTYWATPARYW
jgi:hypothetical protein